MRANATAKPPWSPPPITAARYKEQPARPGQHATALHQPGIASNIDQPLQKNKTHPTPLPSPASSRLHPPQAVTSSCLYTNLNCADRVPKDMPNEITMTVDKYGYRRGESLHVIRVTRRDHNFWSIAKPRGEHRAGASVRMDDEGCAWIRLPPSQMQQTNTDRPDRRQQSRDDGSNTPRRED